MFYLVKKGICSQLISGCPPVIVFSPCFLWPAKTSVRETLAFPLDPGFIEYRVDPTKTKIGTSSRMTHDGSLGWDPGNDERSVCSRPHLCSPLTVRSIMPRCAVKGCAEKETGGDRKFNREVSSFPLKQEDI